MTSARFDVTGVVQGVGFRPFVYRLATESGLGGFVGNDSTRVFIEVVGPSSSIDAFERRLQAERPPLARIDSIVRSASLVTAPAFAGFSIVESADVAGERTLYAYVLTEEAPATVISLGVFTDKARAEQVSIIARMSGFEPRTIERLREADVFWLDIDRQASAGLPSLEQLGGGDPSQLPAVELRRCPEPELEPEPAPANP